MADRYVTVEARGEVALVRIDRPPANALDPDLLEQGHAVLADVQRSQPGAVVMVGREGFFSAGVDLKLAPSLDRDGQRAVVEGINRLFAGWYSLSRPLVAAVNGHAVAGGLILALCADHRVGPAEGRFGLTELRVGVGYPAAAMAVVQAELSPRVARRVVLRSDLFGAGEALDLGLLDELVAGDEVLDRALAVAEELASLPAGTYATVKRQLRAATMARLEEVTQDGADPMLAEWLSEETADAAAGAVGAGPVSP